MAPVHYWGKLDEKFFEPVADFDYGNIILFAFLLVLMYASYSQFTLLFIVRSDQGGSRNLFSNANDNTKLSNVTLVFDD